jgi:ABC-2 type transport system permease protein
VSATTEAPGSRAARGVDPGLPEFGHATFDASHLPPMRPPSDVTGLKAALERRYVLKLLVKREIKARYQGSILGLLWSYINPLSQFCIYFFIMGTIFGLHKGIPNFAVHIFSAIVIVHFFTETMGAGTRSIVRNGNIVKKMAMPREMFPVATMLTSLYHVFPQVVILVVVASLYGWTPDLYGMAAFACALAIIMILGIGIALLLSAANVFFRDVSNAVSIVSNLLRFVVPMIYSYEQVKDRFGPAEPYYLYNPVADAVLLSQRAFWAGSVDKHAAKQPVLPDNLLLHGLGAVGISLVVLAIGQLVFSRLEHKIPERL